jgi:hypothetical protein
MCEEITEERAMWRDQIVRLKEEIHVMEKELEDTREKSLDMSDESIEEILQQLDFESATGMEPACETVGCTKKSEALLAAMTGLKFEAVSHQTLEENESDAKIWHELTGTCYGWSFKVQFMVKESEVVHEVCSSNLIPRLSVEDVSKPFVQGQIQELNIEVDCSIEKHLRSALKRVKDENSLHGFFQVLTAFTACYKKGDNLFHKLKKEHKGLIDVSTDEDLPVLVIRPPSEMGVTFKMTWIPDVQLSNKVQPYVQLHCTKPDDAKFSRDVVKLLRSVPEQFHVLTKEVGHEAAIRLVVSKLL